MSGRKGSDDDSDFLSDSESETDTKKDSNDMKKKKEELAKAREEDSGLDSSGISDNEGEDSQPPQSVASKKEKLKQGREAVFDSSDDNLSDEDEAEPPRPSASKVDKAKAAARAPDENDDSDLDSDSDLEDGKASAKRKKPSASPPNQKKVAKAAADSDSDLSESDEETSPKKQDSKKSKKDPAPSTTKSLGLSDDSSDDEDEDDKPKKRKKNDDSDDDDDEDDKEQSAPKKKPKKKKNAFIESEAEESSDAEGEDEDEDEEKGNDYEYDDFVVREDEVDEEEVRRKIPKKKKRGRLKQKRGLELAEDDLALIAESKGEAIAGEEIMYTEEAARRGDDEDVQMFKSDAPSREVDGGSDEEGDDDNWLVEDIPTMPGVRSSSQVGPSKQDLYEAMAIFGDGASDFFGDDAGKDQAEEDLGLGSDDEIEGTGEKKTSSFGAFDRKTVKKKGAIDPNVKVEKFLTDRDEMIRQDDVPERLQLRMPGRGDISDGERRDEAEWIFRQLEFRHKDAMQTGWAAGAIKAIEKVLAYLQVERVEVPFIYHYRKDYFIHHLKQEHLWMIYELDEKWEQLQSRRLRIEKLSNCLVDKTKTVDAAIQELEQLAKLGLDEDPIDSDDEEMKEQSQQKKEKREQRIEDARTAVVVAQRELDQAKQAMREDTEEGSDKEDELEDQVNKAQAKVQEAEASLAAITSECKAEEEEEAERATQAVKLKELRAMKAKAIKTQQEAPFDVPDAYRRLITQAAEEDLLKDMQDFLGLVQDQEDVGLEGSNHRKRAMRSDRDKYRTCRKAGVRRYLAKWALSVPQFGAEIAGADNYVLPKPPTPGQKRPLDLAAEFTSDTFPKAEDVMKAGRFMLATEVAAEPFLRHKCRSIFKRHATVSTLPTQKGRTEIDFFHPLHGLQYIQRKPVLDFLHSGDRTQFLKIVKAERDGFLTYTIHPPERVREVEDNRGEFHEKWELDLQVFLRGFESKWTGEPSKIPSDYVPSRWEKERRAVLEEALVNFILPKLEDELRGELLQKAREEVVREAAKALFYRVSVGPFRRAEVSLEQRLLKPQHNVKAVGIACNDAFGKSNSAFAASLYPNGTIQDIYQFPERDTEETKKKLKRFLMDSRPDVIVINTGGGMRCRFFGRMMYKFLQEAIQMHKDSTYYDDDDDHWECKIIHVRDDFASVFAQSVRGVNEFPEQPELVRMAVSLGRYAQNPLAEVAAMWATMDEKGLCGRDFLFLKLHPMQELVAPQRLLRAYEQTLINVVCETGVDINDVVEHSHLAGPLIFVGGLGPRKAAALRQGISRNLKGIVSNRKDFLERRLMGPLVYTNSAGFLRVSDKGSLVEAVFNPLDGTRIHPECYNTHDWASKICADALEVEHNPQDYIQTVEGVMDDSTEQLRAMLNKWNSHQEYDPLRDEEIPDKLADLDLESYAEMLRRQGNGLRIQQLEDIKNEIRYPYLDRRIPLREPSEDDLFEWITGETDATLRPGLIVNCEVLRVEENKVQLTLDGGVRGAMFKDQCKDEFVTNCADFYRRGDRVTAVVLDVRKKYFEVRVSGKDSEKAKAPHMWEVPKSIPKPDRFFSLNRALKDYEAQKHALQEMLEKSLMAQEKLQSPDAREPAQSSATPTNAYFIRNVVHQNFKNWTYAEAERELSKAAVGEAVLRPSSKGVDMLTLSWVFQPGMVKHQEVKEEGKDGDIGLGKQLTIKNETYEDIDELIARYVDPMNDLVNEMIKYRKFKPNSREEVDAMLTKEKEENEQIIPYYFSIYAKQPGYFELSFVPNKNIKREIVTVSPDGMILGEKTFTHVNELVAWFKKNYQSLVYRQHRQRQQQHAHSQSHRSHSSGSRGHSSHHRHHHQSSSSHRERDHHRDRDRDRDRERSNRHSSSSSHQQSSHTRGALRHHDGDRQQPGGRRNVNNQPAWLANHPGPTPPAGGAANPPPAPMEVDTGYQRSH